MGLSYEEKKTLARQYFTENNINEAEALQGKMTRDQRIGLREFLIQKGANLKPLTLAESDGYITPPFDPRFPNQNQTRNCWQNYVDFHRCQKLKGEDYEQCYYFKWVYGSLCPFQWVEKWDEQREKGAFAGKI